MLKIFQLLFCVQSHIVGVPEGGWSAHEHHGFNTVVALGYLCNGPPHCCMFVRLILIWLTKYVLLCYDFGYVHKDDEVKCGRMVSMRKKCNKMMLMLVHYNNTIMY